ncbi:hemolysin family protein [Methanimicrococcus blatticola]|uniref:Putative hemolysin n=1 Tax=Methanimicrococcus blatticola TaxID=91560 RepID=A0A484F6A3_9EURY|nr:hemolysin family protein [Methanimicrococcus blatticola]MBZ3935466.1 hemolysin family protein [Methanimicrococcus blatticola]MCC2509109.1 hemolysin family protein [Methanimicrococcus blatticola]TDQ69522.1 putative hemolysin [Methanimicrococcus blatticola]
MAYTEIIVILVLILINGLLSLSEVAITSSRKSRLRSAAKDGKPGAQKALDLAEDPSRFLSTVQIGITTISVFICIYAGASLSGSLAEIFSSIGIIEDYARPLSVLVVVLVVTYFLIVLGELIPKKIGYSRPESIASIISRPMNWISILLSPITWFVNGSANFVSQIFGIKAYEPATTEEDVIAAVQEGIDGGAIDETEQDLVERIFSLDDRKVSSLITHKNDLIFIEVSATQADVLATIKKTPFSVYPVTDGGIDNIVGVLLVKELVGEINNPDFHLENVMQTVNFLPDNMTILSVLENFREARHEYAIITDEFGSIIGLVTLSDIFEALVGDTSSHPSHEEYEIFKRSPNTWLIDGQYPFYDFLEYFDLLDYRNEYPYNTLSGMILDKFGKIPGVGDTLEWLHYEIEVVDMDSARIDKVLITDKGSAPSE